MAYMKIITSSTTWTCPKTGTYKIICVGAGGDGESSYNGASSGKCGAIKIATADYTAGATVQCSFSSGVSAFGSVLSAAKGGTASIIKYKISSTDAVYVGGEGGYTLDGVYGGNGEKLIKISDAAVHTAATKSGGAAGETGLGYGAGGGACHCIQEGQSTIANSTNGNGGAIIIAEM